MSYPPHDAAYWAQLHETVDRELKAMRQDLRERILLAISEVHSGDVIEAQAIRKAMFIALAAWFEQQADKADVEMSYRELAGMAETFVEAAQEPDE